DEIRADVCATRITQNTSHAASAAVAAPFDQANARHSSRPERPNSTFHTAPARNATPTRARSQRQPPPDDHRYAGPRNSPAIAPPASMFSNGVVRPNTVGLDSSRSGGALTARNTFSPTRRKRTE